jgi:phosphoglycolate phosphatase
VNARALIFDLDGTLLDTLDDIAFSMNAALKSFGAPQQPVQEYKRFVGQGLDVLAWRVLPEDRRDDETVKQCVGAMRAVYAGRWAHSTRPYHGIIEMLGSLKRRAIPMAVFSNKAHDFTVRIVTHFFGTETFYSILGGGKFPFKPDPAGALFLAGELKVSPKDILYIGDSDIDMHTATNAGMYPVGVTWGFRSRQELMENGALVLIDRPEELITLIDHFSRLPSGAHLDMANTAYSVSDVSRQTGER